MPQVRALPASLRCGPCARHIYPSLVLVQPRKTRPCLTKILLMGRKESNQAKLLLIFLMVHTLCNRLRCILLIRCRNHARIQKVLPEGF